jgi:uncharacterized membrane protein YsdA (DUF1294 family)
MLLPIVIGGYAVVSLITFVAYAVDKRRAVRQRRRIPERTLHLLELLGGWPGALLAQRIVRHKRQKVSYVLVLAGIVLIHLIAWALVNYFLATRMANPSN